MILRVTTITLILFIVYECLLRFADFKFPTAQNQVQANTIEVQDFLYSQVHAPTLIVGSSLSFRLTTLIPSDSIPFPVENLACAGLSSLDGLEILQKSGHIPSLVIIETNFLQRNKDTHFIESQCNQPQFILRKLFYSLRDRNQPVGFLPHLIAYLKKGHRIGEKKKNIEYDEVSKLKMLDVNKNMLNSIIPEKDLHECAESLVHYIKFLQKNNCRVVFIELPVDSVLSKCKQVSQVHKLANDLSNRYEIEFISPEKNSNYNTTDGLHMCSCEIPRYWHYLSTALNQSGVKNCGFKK